MHGTLENNFGNYVFKIPWICSQLARRIENKLVFRITDFHDLTDKKHLLNFGEEKSDLEA